MTLRSESLMGWVLGSAICSLTCSVVKKLNFFSCSTGFYYYISMIINITKSIQSRYLIWSVWSIDMCFKLGLYRIKRICHHNQAFMPSLSCNSISCLVKPVFGWQQGLLACIFLRHWSNDNPYFCIMYEIKSTEHLEIPAAQWTKTFVYFLLFSMKS